VHHQVVIGHRDKELKSLGAYFTDVVGVLFKHHVLQMCSSSTFAYQVVEQVGEIKQEKETNFQVLFSRPFVWGLVSVNHILYYEIT
jgi:hypothetical protein